MEEDTLLKNCVAARNWIDFLCLYKLKYWYKDRMYEQAAI